jgi:predicted transcriptional regulator
MDKQSIKNQFHKLIDSIDDESVLQLLYEDAVEYSKVSDVADDELTEDQMAEIKEGLRQIENGEFTTHEEMLEKIKAWKDLQ